MPRRKTIYFLDRLAKGIIVLFVASSLFLICLQVFFRFGLNNALSWPEEVVVYLNIWFSFLAAVYVQRERGHIRLSFFYEKCSTRTKLLLDIFSNIAVITFMAVVCYQGIIECISIMDLETSALRISRALPFVAVPLVGALIIVVNVILITEDYRNMLNK